MVLKSYVSFNSLLTSIISESIEKSLKDSLDKHIDMEDKPYDSREQLNTMDSGTLPYI